MGTEQKSQPEGIEPNITRSITRTIRAAIRLGEDYLTIEESVTLPLDASDEDIHHAVALGQRIYLAQRDTLESQIAAIRETHMASIIQAPEPPASDGQRIYINRLASSLGWSAEQLGSYAHEQLEIDDLQTMRKGQASILIDTLKHMLEERGASYLNHVRSSPPPSSSSPNSSSSPSGSVFEQETLSERQYRALMHLAQKHGYQLDDETHQRFGVGARELNGKQAAELIEAWQSSRP